MNTQSYDTVVIGGGAAGVAAAVGASKTGNSVLLLEKSEQLGGLATGAEVGTICGLYLNSNDDSFQFNVDEFTENFSKDIGQLSHTKPIVNSANLKFLPYSIEIFRNHCETILNKKNASYSVDCEVVDVVCSGAEITSLKYIQNGIEQNVNVKKVVDASGASIVSRLLGEELTEPSFSQTITQIFTIHNLNFSSEQNLALVLLMNFKKNNDHDLSIVPGSYSLNQVSLKLNFKSAISPDEAKSNVKHVFAQLKSSIIGFKNAELLSIASQIGLRIGTRPVGKYTLTKEDVISCRKFENSIANGNWPIEQWDAEKGLILEKLKENDFYQIPGACLESKNFSNLFFAGRNISATDEAIASARVIGTCLQTGYAAGRLSIQ